MSNENEKNDMVDTGFVDVMSKKERKRYERKKREKRRREQEKNKPKEIEETEEETSPVSAKTLDTGQIKKLENTGEVVSSNTDELNKAIEEAASNDEKVERKKNKSSLIGLTGFILILSILYYVGLSLCTEYNNELLLIINSAFLVFMNLIIVISAIASNKASRCLALFNVLVFLGFIATNILFIFDIF